MRYDLIKQIYKITFYCKFQMPSLSAQFVLTEQLFLLRLMSTPQISAVAENEVPLLRNLKFVILTADAKAVVDRKKITTGRVRVNINFFFFFINVYDIVMRIIFNIV